MVRSKSAAVWTNLKVQVKLNDDNTGNYSPVAEAERFLAEAVATPVEEQLEVEAEVLAYA